MIVSKLGDGLAVRLDNSVVETLGLKEGDEVEVRVAKRTLKTPDQAAREAALIRMRKLRGTLPIDFKFNREEANER